MAISRTKKTEIVAEVSDLLNQSKMTVLTRFAGLSVPEMQELRRNARQQDVAITVAKNRLVKIAVDQTEALKGVDTSLLEGQLGLVFGLEDEVAPAQVLADFAKSHPQIEFVGAYTAEGETLSADQVRELAKLPSKDVLRGQLVGTIAAPLSGFVNVLSGNIRGLANVLNARAQELEG